MNTSLTLAAFKNKISDLARPNRFEVIISPPSIYSEYLNSEYTLLPWLAETAQIPQRMVGEITMKFHGMPLILPGDYAREDLTIGFLNSYGWEGRNFFERWMEFYEQSVNSDNSKTDGVTLVDDCTITVTQVGRVGDTLASYIFYNVFPKSISAIELNMGTENSVEKFTVVFAYSHFKPTNILD